MTTTRLLIVHARSPLHAGTGQATAAVDLPIARDRATGLPLLPGSSLKGALRARSRQLLNGETIKLFGPETDNASVDSGAICFTDARLLLLPVRSVAGTFAWITSPLLLAQLAREAALAGYTDLPPLPAPGKQSAMTVEGSLLHVGETVILEEFDLGRQPGAEKWAKVLAPMVFADPTWQDLLQKRLCIVSDDVMSFLALHATEIVTRVSINPETGTALGGQLWTEENLPAESVLLGLVEEQAPERHRPGAAGEYLDRITKELLSQPIQLGGKATVGRGRCTLRLIHGGH